MIPPNGIPCKKCGTKLHSGDLYLKTTTCPQCGYVYSTYADTVAQELISVQPMNPNLLDPWFKNNIKVHHDTSGDSYFSFQIKMIVGQTDTNGDSTISIGGIRFNIHKLFSDEMNKEYFILQEGQYDTRIFNSPDFFTKDLAINWLINHIKGY